MSNRSRANKSIGNKINNLDNRVSTTEKKKRAVDNSAETVVLPPDAVNSRVIRRGSITTDELGIVNAITSDSTLVVTIPPGDWFSLLNYNDAVGGFYLPTGRLYMESGDIFMDSGDITMNSGHIISDYLPYSYATGWISTPSVSSATQVNATVTLPVGRFTTGPAVVATPLDTGLGVGRWATYSPSSTQFTMSVIGASGSATGPKIMVWHASQRDSVNGYG